jgi:iron complex outermembrane receptor protein
VEFVYDGSAFELTVPLTPASVSSTLNVVEQLNEVSGSVTKSDARLLETPQSISIIGPERMQEQAPLTVQDALRYSAGIRTEQYGFDARGDWASMRGGSFGQFMNGLRMLFGYYNNIRPEPFALERIEVMRGPSSVLFGQGGFGGVINLITKRPSPQRRGEIQIQAGHSAANKWASTSWARSIARPGGSTDSSVWAAIATHK